MIHDASNYDVGDVLDVDDNSDEIVPIKLMMVIKITMVLIVKSIVLVLILMIMVILWNKYVYKIIWIVLYVHFDWTTSVFS